jgi:hypothetical protein
MSSTELEVNIVKLVEDGIWMHGNLDLKDTNLSLGTFSYSSVLVGE